MFAKVTISYDEFLEICTNLSEAPFTVSPGFAKINYKFTDEQLKNYHARIDGFHSDVIKWYSQNREVLRILIYTRLKINKK